MAKYVLQWYWDRDHLGNKYKASYFGPRLDWMNLDKSENDKRKIKKIRKNVK